MKKEIIKKSLNKYHEACEDLLSVFIETYFSGDERGYWVGEDVGGVAIINDYYFSISRILHFLKYNYSKNKMFEYYNYELDILTENSFLKEGDKGTHVVCVRDYIKLVNLK